MYTSELSYPYEMYKESKTEIQIVVIIITIKYFSVYLTVSDPLVDISLIFHASVQDFYPWKTEVIESRFVSLIILKLLTRVVKN